MISKDNFYKLLNCIYELKELNDPNNRYICLYYSRQKSKFYLNEIYILNFRIYFSIIQNGKVKEKDYDYRYQKKFKNNPNIFPTQPYKYLRRNNLLNQVEDILTNVVIKLL